MVEHIAIRFNVRSQETEGKRQTNVRNMRIFAAAQHFNEAVMGSRAPG